MVVVEETTIDKGKICVTGFPSKWKATEYEKVVQSAYRN